MYSLPPTVSTASAPFLAVPLKSPLARAPAFSNGPIAPTALSVTTPGRPIAPSMTFPPLMIAIVVSPPLFSALRSLLDAQDATQATEDGLWCLRDWRPLDLAQRLD